MAERCEWLTAAETGAGVTGPVVWNAWAYGSIGMVGSTPGGCSAVSVLGETTSLLIGSCVGKCQDLVLAVFKVIKSSGSFAINCS